ncbi:MAG: CPBP family intramembrane metalloprotease [Oscillatoriales cyanobacterium]|nr:MAG: CPBP family intramembrane metalloprotease [Oscillatoriales cyanobacterium]TAH25055.1 MAG: CPBP family intramembrane metalloprotease [Oscillatoriales cyanobacterium]
MAEKLPENPEFEPLTRTQVLVAMGVTAIILLVIAKLWLQFGSVSLLPIKLIGIDLLKGCAVGLSITGASAIVYHLWPAYRRSADVYLEVVLKPLFWPDLIWLGLLPGLSEELLFRGVMMSALGLNATGLILSSFCFGILHLGGIDQWPYAIWATAVGLLLGYSFLDTGNLLVPIIAHICTNLISSCVWKWENTSPNRF